MSKQEMREREIPLEFSCTSCGDKGFKLNSCTYCGQAKLCEQVKCHEQHAAICHKSDRGFLLQCEIDMGRELDIEDVESDAAGRILDLGTSNSCVRHGHNQHADFINFAQFTLDHLPQEIRHQDIFNFVTVNALRTVRITTKWTSMNRPDNDPYADQRGLRRSRVATGSFHAMAAANTFVRKVCEVSDCHRKSDLGHTHNIFVVDLFVYTNKHVVFDEDEMRRTYVEFFYDSYDKAGVVKEYGREFHYQKSTSDKTFFTVTVHDENFLKLTLDISEAYIVGMGSVSTAHLEAMKGFVALVSHPHGMPKKVSIGKIVRRFEEKATTQNKENAKGLGKLYAHWAKQYHEQYLNIQAQMECCSRVDKGDDDMDKAGKSKNFFNAMINRTLRKYRRADACGVNCQCKKGEKKNIMPGETEDRITQECSVREQSDQNKDHMLKTDQGKQIHCLNIDNNDGSITSIREITEGYKARETNTRVAVCGKGTGNDVEQNDISIMTKPGTVQEGGAMSNTVKGKENIRHISEIESSTIRLADIEQNTDNTSLKHQRSTDAIDNANQYENDRKCQIVKEMKDHEAKAMEQSGTKDSSLEPSTVDIAGYYAQSIKSSEKDMSFDQRGCHKSKRANSDVCVVKYEPEKEIYDTDTEANTLGIDTSHKKEIDDKIDDEKKRVDFMLTATFPVATIFHTAAACQGSSGGPVFHGGFHFDGYWHPLTGSHVGYDLNCHCSFFRYNKFIA